MNDKDQRLMLESRTSESRLATNSGLKIGNKKSVFSAKQESKQLFDQKIDKIQTNQSDYFQKAGDLAFKFKALISDKTLPENKGPLIQSMEKEVLLDWQNYILEQNNPTDDNLSTPEGFGSLSAILMIFNSLLKMRDKDNLAEFRIQALEEEIKNLKAAKE